MREDESSCRCYGRKNESLAYNLLVGSGDGAGQLTVSGRLIVLGF